MHAEKGFIRFAAICCFLSVITTLGIHLYFPDPPANFEQRILMFRDITYLVNRWWVILHCLLVIVAMWGVAILLFKQNPGSTGLGFLSFAVFGIAEITRQLLVLFYINELREQYFLATDPALKETTRIALLSAGQLTAPLFGLFILMFGLGGTCYGISLLHSKGLSKVLSIMFLISGIASFALMGNSFWRSTLLEDFLNKYNASFTPLMRSVTAVWLWKQSVKYRKQVGLVAA